MPSVAFRRRMPGQSGLSGLGYGNESRGYGGLKIRLAIAAAIALFAIISWAANKQVNPVTGEAQRVSLTPDQEIQLGLQAMPEMIRQHGGELPDQRAQAHVDMLGEELLRAVDRWMDTHPVKDKNGQLIPRENPYRFDFHLLRDPKTVNAFALPGGQVFMTSALYDRLKTDGQKAGVLGHEIGHVLQRHGAQRMASQQLTQQLIVAAGAAGGSENSARMAAAIGQMINMKYGREDELESDGWGVRLMILAGYDPYAMLGVMDVLEEASGGGPPEMMSTHPKPANRKKYIQEVIEKVTREDFGGKLPDHLKE